MPTVRLTGSLQWLAAEQSEIEETGYFDAAVDETEPEHHAVPPSGAYGVDIGRVLHDFDVLAVPDEQRDALWDAYRSLPLPSAGIRYPVGIQNQAGIRQALRQGFGVARDQGEWGDVVNRQRTYRTVEVVGLSCPEIAGASTEATFSFAVGTEQGLKVTLGVASMGWARTYSLNYELNLECASGEAKVGCLYVPLDRVTQRYRPPTSAEWFELVRYEPIELDPKAPGIGTRTDAVSPHELLERANPDGPPVGGGSTAGRATIKKDQGLSVAMEIGPKFADDAASLTVSAKVEASSSVAISYSLPAASPCTLFWLSPIAGACIVRS